MNIIFKTRDRDRRRCPVLFFQDDPAQWLTIRSAMEHSFPEVEPILMTTLVTTSAYLHTVSTVSRAIPRLIFIDLSLPSREDGLAFLIQLKADIRFERIPIVVLHDSDTPEGVLQAYTLGAACYLTKPLNYTDWLICFHEFKSRWWTLAKLPVSL